MLVQEQLRDLKDKPGKGYIGNCEDYCVQEVILGEENAAETSLMSQLQKLK